jgi:pyruvate-formate lyase-activating enzyme
VLLAPDTLRALGTSRVVLSGGEPLLYPHLDDVLRYYARHVESRVVITNGLLLSSSRRQHLRSAGATGFALSLDTTDPALYQATRGWGEAQLGRVLANLRSAAGAAEAETMELGLNAVVSHATANWACVGAVLALGSHLGLRRVKFQPVFDDGYLSRSAPELALGTRDVPGLNDIADNVARFEGVATNPPGFWRDLARVAAGTGLDGTRCGLGPETVLVTDERLARCYWVPDADAGTVRTEPAAIRVHQSTETLLGTKSGCSVDARCFCLQPLAHEWSTRV